jgi:hypothetical protein
MVGRTVALETEERVTRRLLAAAVMLLAAAFLTLLARDTWHWSRAMHDADARAAIAPVSPNAWRADATLPSGLAKRLLGIDDDLAFRATAMRALQTASHTPSAKTQKARSVVEAALARIARGGDPVRGSIAAGYLGVLLYADPPSPDQAANAYVDPTQTGPSNQQTPEQRAQVQFENAVRLDPGNDNAQRNLELMLRQPTPAPHHGSPQAGGGERLGRNGSGARPAGRGY